MALTDVTTTGNLADYLGSNFDPRRTKMYLTTNAEGNLITDKSTGKVRLGGGKVEVAANGDFTATHWAPGADANPASWQTTYHIDSVDAATRERKTVSIGPFTVTASGLLTALIDEQAVPAEYLTTVTQQLDAKVTQAETARTGAEAARDQAAVNAKGIDAVAASALAPGAAPTVSLTGDNPSRTLNLGIPAGVADDASMTAVANNPSSSFSSALSASTADAISGTPNSGLTPQAAVDERIAAVSVVVPHRVERIGFGGDSNTSYNNGDNWTLMLTNLSRGRAQRVGYWAQGGIDIQGWRDIQLPDVLATTGMARPHAMMLMLGTNNDGDNIQTTLNAYRDGILLPLRDAGIEPWVCSIPPREDSQKTWAQRFNNALRALASEVDVPFFDVYAALADPATGNFKAGYSATGVDGSGGADGIHFFKQEPQRAVALALRTQFLGLLRGPGAPFPATNVDSQNSVPNARMLTGNGQFNGVNNTAGYASQWQSTSGLTISSGAPALLSDAYGTWQQLENIAASGTILNTLARVPVIPGHTIVLCGKFRAQRFGADAANYSASGTFYATPTGGSSLGSVGLLGTYRVDMTDMTADPSDFLSGWTRAVVPAGAYFCRLGVFLTKSTGTLADKRLDYGMFAALDLNRLAAEREVADAAMTSGSATVTSASAAFTAGDVGKTVNLYGAASNQGPLIATISAVTNATTATLSVTASSTVSAAALVIAPAATV